MRWIQINKNINLELVAPCGFYCGSCPVYLAGNCEGCYNGGYKECYTYNCVINKDINFCGECSDFPCEYIMNNEKSTIFNKLWLGWIKEKEK